MPSFSRIACGMVPRPLVVTFIVKLSRDNNNNGNTCLPQGSKHGTCRYPRRSKLAKYTLTVPFLRTGTGFGSVCINFKSYCLQRVISHDNKSEAQHGLTSLWANVNSTGRHTKPSRLVEDGPKVTALGHFRLWGDGKHPHHATLRVRGDRSTRIRLPLQPARRTWRHAQSCHRKHPSRCPRLGPDVSDHADTAASGLVMIWGAASPTARCGNRRRL
jgi:hypothetical protein